MTPALLALADGRVFRGDACGAGGEASGEVVFNTAMTGYQEILTDPSYRGQMVCMTYPLIGNYGISPEDVESRRPWVNGFIVKEMCGYPSNWRGRMRLEDYLREHGIVAIQGIDTRALTRHLRDHGAQEGIISTVEADADRLVERARALPGLVGRDLVSEVSVAEPHGWDQGTWDLARGYTAPPEPRFRVVAFDSGIKQNILRQLAVARVRRDGGAGPDAGRGGPRDEAAWGLPLQWAGRSGGGPLPRRVGARPRRPDAHLRHLPREIRSWGWPSGAAPTSSSSAITAPTTRCAISRRGAWRSPRRTTASRWTRRPSRSSGWTKRTST